MKVPGMKQSVKTMGQSMTKLTINRKPKGIYGTPQKTTQAAQEQDKTTSAHKVMPGNQKAQQKPTGATPWRHMTKRQRKNRRRINRLTELWPELFSREAPKPLKVGIFDDLMQDLAVRGWHSVGGIACDAGILCTVSALLPRLNGWWGTLRPERPAVRRGDTTGTTGRRNAAGGAE